MAGDWIKMRVDLHDDPSVIAIASAVGLDEFGVVGRLHKLWSWADKQTIDGSAVGVTDSWIDRLAGCDGFAAAMSSAGWLEIDGNQLQFPKFDRHNGTPAKSRAGNTARQQLSRNLRDKGATREEKRREESLEVSNDTSLPGASTPPADRSEFGFPVRGGKTWYLTKLKLAEYEDAYSDLDLRVEFIKARQWLRVNPAKCKTARGMAGFLTRWLNKALDDCGGSKRVNGSRQPTAPPQPAWERFRYQMIQKARGDPVENKRLRGLSDEEWQEMYEERKA